MTAMALPRPAPTTLPTAYPRRPWTPEEERFALANDGTLSAPQIARFVGHSPMGVRLKLLHLRRQPNDPHYEPKRAAIADEVCKHVAFLIESHALTPEDAWAIIQRLRAILAASDAVIVPRLRWPVTRWFDELAA